jgi:glycolate oxidase iron-sulfur subunit
VKAEPSPLAALDYSVLQQCMHCGLCLPTCPTYLETGRERNSPRGRISLMRAIADGGLEATKTFADEMDYCLGCLACTTACPAGVDYGTLFETARSEAEHSGVAASPKRTIARFFTLRVLLRHPRLLRSAARLLRFYETSGLRRMVRKSGIFSVLPRGWGELERQALPIGPRFSDELIAAVEEPSDPASHQVAVLTGCIQDVAFSDVNRATVDVLLANACRVSTPRAQSCCGSLHAHNGDLETARELARRQIDSIDLAGLDAIISNSAGCGSHLKRYGHLLADDPAYAGRAAVWSSKVRDISEWLVEIGFRRPVSIPSGDPPVTVTYHEACHLCHGQKISSEPRDILRSIPGYRLAECAEATMCCGSAGVYSITQPETAAWLRDRKIGHLRATGAAIVATANPGCQLQIQQGLKSIDSAGENYLRVAHPIVLLAEAYHIEKELVKEL